MSSKLVYPATPFTVKVKVNDLNIRSSASMDGKITGVAHKGVYTITKVNGGWGLLKSGLGWIYLENTDYCTVNGAKSKDYSLIGEQLELCLTDIKNLPSYQKLVSLL